MVGVSTVIVGIHMTPYYTEVLSVSVSYSVMYISVYDLVILYVVEIL
jgi:hypothetical protein